MVRILGLEAAESRSNIFATAIRFDGLLSIVPERLTECHERVVQDGELWTKASCAAYP